MRARRQPVVLASALLVLGLLVPPPSAQADTGLAFTDGHGLTVVSTRDVQVHHVTAQDVTFRTDALDHDTTVRILLPRDFDPSGATRYPVLFLLHGGAADYTSWTAQGGIAHLLTEELPLITVMPDAGRSAWYTNWYNNGLGGGPLWETYHIEQLLPWVDDNLPTLGSRSGRAIAGLSSGGFGTMSYASRHPDLFVAAAAFSGAVDTNTPPVLAGKFIDALALQDRGLPGSLFGIRELEEVRWRGSNPWDLAPNLAHTELVLRTGNGDAGGEFGGGGPSDPVGMYLEAACHRQSVSLHERLTDLGIDHLWDDYGPGTHNFHYWNRSLAQTLPILMDTFAENRPDPETFSYRSIESPFSVYGWEVTIDRPVVEFASFDDVSSEGFTLSGSGDAVVVTAPAYRPGEQYEIALSGGFGERDEMHTADDEGRLHLDVPLGPPNLVQQQFTPLHTSPLTQVHTTSVAITPSGGSSDPGLSPSAVELTGATEGRATTEVELTARLTTADGPVAGAPVVFELQGGSHAASTGGDGVATVPVRLAGPAGETPLTVRFDGDDDHEPSSVTGTFTVLHAETAITVSGRREGPGAALRAELRSGHDGSTVAEREVVFTVDGDEAGRATTDANGATELPMDRSPRQGAAVQASFAGDDTFEPVTAATTWRGNQAPAADGSSGSAISAAPASNQRGYVPVLVWAVAGTVLLAAGGARRHASRMAS